MAPSFAASYASFRIVIRSRPLEEELDLIEDGEDEDYGGFMAREYTAASTISREYTE